MISSYIVQFSEDHDSSVMICVEDGWDTAAQLISISELLLDPYYRTFDGFQTLIEREWFAFGHRFSHRSNQTTANKTGFAPVFLQFLDLVHQVNDPHCIPINRSIDLFIHLDLESISDRIRIQ